MRRRVLLSSARLLSVGCLAIMFATGALQAQSGTWNTVMMSPSAFLNDLCVLPDGMHGWAVGNSGAGGQVVSLILHTTDGGAHWARVSFPGTSTTGLMGVWFVSADTGWVVGSGGTIYRTTNAGSSWTLQASGSGRVLNKAHFVNGRQGWITGGRQDGSSYLVLKTTDGGANWQDQSFGTDCYSCVSIWFSDSLNGWIGGNDASINPFIEATTDGGSTWNKQTTNLPTGAGEVSAINFVASSIGWASTSSLYETPFGSVLHTTDGGANWSVQYATGLTYNYCLSCQDTLRLAIASSEVIPSSMERIFTSTDGGQNWDAHTPPINQYTQGIAYRGNDLWIASMNSSILHSPDNGNSWAWQAQAPYWRSLAWSDSMNGWAVSGSNAGTDGYCARSTDGGVTWAYAPGVPGGAQVQFVDDMHGWMLTEGTGGTIKRTTNGGVSWSQFGIGGSAWIGAACFASPDSGWAFGGSGNVRFTSNGGATWTSRNPGTTAYLETGYFISPTEGWVAGGYGGANSYIGHTTNGGESWTSQPPAANDHFYASFFLNGQLGWLGAVSGYVQGTTDGGASWQMLSQVSHDYVNGILMTDNLNGWLVASDQGNSSSPGYGFIYSTSDGGSSWQLQWTAPWPNGNLSGITTRRGKEPWVCGFHATILKFVPTVGLAEEGTAHSALRLKPGAIEVGPNPCRGILSLELPEGGVAHGVVLSDAAGRRVRQIALSARARVDVDLRDLPDGVYFLSSRAGTRSEVRIVLMK
jgi:photosystem II stability/assembly factor-like uncharacterized protein